MKKNKMLRVASILLIAVLLSTSVISGTFAKYVTSDSASDTARVAKFGVVASIEGNLFGESYIKGGTNKIQAWESATHESVAVAAQGEDLVAPGTVGDVMTFTVSGDPEVSTTITFGDKTIAADGTEEKVADSDIVLAEGSFGVMVEWTGTITTETVVGKYTLADGTYTKVTTAPTTMPDKVYELKDAVTASQYLPLNWTVGSTTTAGQTIKSVKTSLASTFAGNFTPHPTYAATPITQTITWDWTFEKGTVSGIYAEKDKEDTILGDMIAAAKGASIAVVVTEDSGATYKTLQYANVSVDNTANTTKAWVAYTGTAPTTAPKSGDALPTGTWAVLTVNFNAALTVAQVD